MNAKRFQLLAEFRTANRPEVRAGLEVLLPESQIEDTALGFKVKAQVEGESAAVLNRTLLAAVRQIARHTTLRTERRSDRSRERFFDYVQMSDLPT